MILLALALQVAAAPAPAPAAGGERFSILARQCGTRDDRGDIVVCDKGEGSRLPLPDEAGPAPGRGANPELSAGRALALEGTPCAATQRGCLVGFGPPVMPIVKALADVVGSALARKPDKRGRVAIPLDEPATAIPATIAAP